MRTSSITSRGVLLLAPIVLAGCDLTTEPKGQLTSQNFFETADHAVQATNATYNMLREWQVHVFSWIGLTDIVSDDATKGSTPGDAAFLLDLDNLLLDPVNLAFADPWAGYYKGVYRANVAIEGIPRVAMDPTLQARLIGENKFLRAYFYFFLARAWGGVPLITQPLRPDEYIQARAGRDQVYDLIEQDLLDAIAVLPERANYAAADLGRATKGAARGLLALLYLYRQDYPNALQYARDVINSAQYSLHADYATLFTPAGENSSESVFEVQAGVTAGGGKQPGEGGANIQYAEVQGVRGKPNIGWGFNTPSEGLEASYELGDPRLQTTILYPWEMIPDGSSRVVYFNPSMQNNRYNQKAFVTPDNPSGSFNAGLNLRRLRYADVLLIAAEAAYQTGNESDARLYLNQVRARARGGQTVTLGFTPELLKDSIATIVLVPSAGTSRVFARYVNPTAAAYFAGLRSFASGCAGSCKPDTVPIPARVDTVDVIQSVNGTPVTTLAEFYAALPSAGGTATLQVQRWARASPTAPLTTQALTINVTAAALLPDVTASGTALRDAIWQERRAELAMEQHRWFDLIRQDAVAPGRAQALMLAVGKTFLVGRHELYPIPAGQVAIAALQQNPGY